MTFICGSKSWIDSGPAYEIQACRAESYVDVKVLVVLRLTQIYAQIIGGAGHHVYADASEKFNTIMRSISDMVDSGEDFTPSAHRSSESDDRSKTNPSEVPKSPRPHENPELGVSN